jgi:hypothetical protein
MVQLIVIGGLMHPTLIEDESLPYIYIFWIN